MLPILHWGIRYKSVRRVIATALQTSLRYATVRRQDHDANWTKVNLNKEDAGDRIRRYIPRSDTIQQPHALWRSG